MIAEKIVNKLSLKLTDNETGTSFIYNCGIYFWKKVEDADAYIMDCDVFGMPLEDKFCIYIKGSKAYVWFYVPSYIVTDAGLITIMASNNYKKELLKANAA